jgi:hypothetical protein
MDGAGQAALMISSDDLCHWHWLFEDWAMAISILAFLPRISLVSWLRGSIFSDLLP